MLVIRIAALAAAVLLIVPGGLRSQSIQQNKPTADKTLIVKILREAADAASGVERNSVLSEITIALVQAGDFAEALRVASLISEPIPRSWAYGRIGEMMAEAGDLPRARQALAQTADHKAMIHGAIAVELARRGEAAAAVQYAESNLRDVAGTLAKIVNAQLDRGDVAGALKTAERIGTRGYSNSRRARALGAIAVVQMKAGDTAAAKKTFDSARRAAQALPASDEGGSPQGVVLKELAVVETNSGNIEGALQSIAAISRGYFKVEAMIAIAAAQREAGERAAALQTLNRAAETARGLGERNWQFTALEKVSMAQAESAEPEKAQATAEAIPLTQHGIYARILALNKVAVAYYTAGTLAQAKAVVQELQRVTGTMSDSDERKRGAREIIAYTQARMRQWKDALETAGCVEAAEKNIGVCARILFYEASQPDPGLTLAAALARLGDRRAVGGILAGRAFRSAIRGDVSQARAQVEPVKAWSNDSWVSYYEGWVKGKLGDVTTAAEAARSRPARIKAHALLGISEGALGIMPSSSFWSMPDFALESDI
ncbi:MAG TPA: hypothetical protein VGH16_21965 [Candidatus Binatia bacterium]